MPVPRRKRITPTPSPIPSLLEDTRQSRLSARIREREILVFTVPLIYPLHQVKICHLRQDFSGKVYPRSFGKLLLLNLPFPTKPYPECFGFTIIWINFCDVVRDFYVQPVILCLLGILKGDIDIIFRRTISSFDYFETAIQKNLVTGCFTIAKILKRLFG